MPHPALALLLIANADLTFAERWSPLLPPPTLEAPAKPQARSHSAPRSRYARTYACQRQTYYVGRHRYWRCKR